MKHVALNLPRNGRKKWSKQAHNLIQLDRLRATLPVTYMISDLSNGIPASWWALKHKQMYFHKQFHQRQRQHGGKLLNLPPLCPQFELQFILWARAAWWCTVCKKDIGLVKTFEQPMVVKCGSYWKNTQLYSSESDQLEPVWTDIWYRQYGRHIGSRLDCLRILDIIDIMIGDQDSGVCLSLGHRIWWMKIQWKNSMLLDNFN